MQKMSLKESEPVHTQLASSQNCHLPALHFPLQMTPALSSAQSRNGSNSLNMMALACVWSCDSSGALGMLSGIQTLQLWSDSRHPKPWVGWLVSGPQNIKLIDFGLPTTTTTQATMPLCPSATRSSPRSSRRRAWTHAWHDMRWHCSMRRKHKQETKTNETPLCLQLFNLLGIELLSLMQSLHRNILRDSRFASLQHPASAVTALSPTPRKPSL